MLAVSGIIPLIQYHHVIISDLKYIYIYTSIYIPKPEMVAAFGLGLPLQYSNEPYEPPKR
jgi:hypothetical protein